MTRWLILLCIGWSGQIAWAVEPATQFELDYLVRPWDRWSLLDHRPANRQLWRQQQPFRVFQADERLAFMSDVLVGTQMPRPGSNLGTWHGHAIADTYFGVRVHENLDVNANLIGLHMSASYGYRSTARILPGFAVHLHGTAGDLQADLLALDLSTVTLGQGLLFEQLPLEGAMGRLRWDDWWFRLLIGGQLHSADDDLFALTSAWKDLQLTWYGWSQEGFGRMPQWLGLSGEVPGLPDSLRLAAEGLARIDGEGRGRTAALARIDWMPQLSRGALHLGYQYRWYAHGYGHLNTDQSGRTFHRPALIWREDAYATNGYEALWPSTTFDQQWHTVMLEAEIPLGRPWIVARIEGELWARLFNDPEGPEDTLVVLNHNGSGGHWWPDPDVRFLHRIGLEVRPFGQRPDRLRLWVINKVAEAIYDNPAASTRNRLVPRRPLIAFELEVFL
jgi:hypothetical protein